MPDDTPLTPSAERMDVRIGVPEEHRKRLADGLAKVLANSYVLLGKTHGFHWNVTGLQFHSLHEMFEEQYQDLQDAVDEVAERIRALGFVAPGSLSDFLRMSDIVDTRKAPDAMDMVRQLAEDNEALSRACKDVVSLCHQAEDTVTEDLMNGRMAAHDKTAWMLRATAA
ncbi:Dps family protein [Caenispirillum salinarum]|uniref:Dps family protein n=1 Tax=Caenispirillum salinarum TaxID=859058 RepID=UPI00384C473F